MRDGGVCAQKESAGNLQNGIIPHGVCASDGVGRSYLDSSWPIKKAER